jgi:hypothetical protein
MHGTRIRAGSVPAAGVLIACLVLCVPGSSRGDVHLVRTDGSGDYPNIQAAITGALAGDVIVLGQGVFTGSANRNIDFLGKRLTLTAAGANGTVVIDCGGVAQGLLFESGEGAGSIVHGISVRNAAGYGVVCEDSSPTLVDCEISGCTDGIYILNGDPTLIGCRIHDTADDGIVTGFSSGGDLIECSVEENQGLGIDGYECDLNVAGGFIRGNAGGLRAYQNAFFEMYGTVVTGNEAASSGGGIFCSEGVFSIRASTISGNAANRGGGIFVEEDAGLSVLETIVWDNCATSSGDEVYLNYPYTPVTFDCCDLDVSGVYGTDYTLSLCIDLDPLFCGPVPCTAAPTPAGDYTLAMTSPCLPGSSPCGRLIGALDLGCMTPVGIDAAEEPSVPAASTDGPLLILSASPNPSAGLVFVEVSVPLGPPARLDVVDAAGRVVATLAAAAGPGLRRIEWDGRAEDRRRAPAGVYFARLSQGGIVAASRFLIVR